MRVGLYRPLVESTRPQNLDQEFILRTRCRRVGLFAFAVCGNSAAGTPQGELSAVATRTARPTLWPIDMFATFVARTFCGRNQRVCGFPRRFAAFAVTRNYEGTYANASAARRSNENMSIVDFVGFNRPRVLKGPRAFSGPTALNGYSADGVPIATPSPLLGGRSAIRRGEILRKAIHMTPGAIPFALFLYPHPRVLPWDSLLIVTLITAILTGFYIASKEIVRRPGETNFYSTCLSYPACILAMLLLFPQHPEFTCVVVVVLGFGDASAYIGGKLVGGRRLPWNPQQDLGRDGFVHARGRAGGHAGLLPRGQHGVARLLGPRRIDGDSPWHRRHLRDGRDRDGRDRRIVGDRAYRQSPSRCRGLSRRNRRTLSDRWSVLDLKRGVGTPSPEPSAGNPRSSSSASGSRDRHLSSV